MSTRQNKKQRKGRNNANNRERTVTTLTEDPNTPYLVPTPSEEPAGSHMPASFPGNSGGGKMHNNNVSMGPQTYPSNNFGYGYPPAYGPVPNMHQQQQHQPQQQQQQPFFPAPSQPHQQQQQSQMPDVRPKVPLPPGKNDLEILQNLKKIILDGQHPFYKAEPSPAALASLYKGTIPTQSQQTGGRPEQGATDYRHDSTDGQAPATPSTGFGQSAAGDRRQPRTQGKDRRPGSRGAGGNPQNNNSGQGNRYNNSTGGTNIGNLNLANLKISRNSSGPPSAGLQTEAHPSDFSSPPAGPNANQDVPDTQRQGRYDYSARPRFQQNDFAAMNDDSGYDPRSPDLSIDGKGSMYGSKDEISPSGGWAPRDAVHPPNDREYDSGRVTTPRPQATGGASNDARPLGGIDRGAGPPGDGPERDRDRSRRGDWHERDRRPSQDRAHPRLTDSRRSSSAAERPFEAEYGPPPVRRGPPEPPVRMDTRPMSEIPPAGDIRPPVDSRPQPDTRADPQPAPARPIDRLGPDTEDIQSSRSSSARPGDVAAPLGSIPPAAPGDNLVDDPSTRPSLKDRMSQPSRLSRTSSEAVTGGSGEHQHQQHHQHPHQQDRSRKPNKFQKGPPGSGYNGPPPPKTGDRAYNRPLTPPLGPPPTSGGGPHPPHRAFNPRSASVEGRSKLPPSGSPASRGPRDFRGPGRDNSRPGNYRPDFHEPRYPGPESDAPRYEGRPYREFSSPPPISGGRGPPGVDTPPGRGDYHQYPPGRRDWGSADDDDYYKSRGWDGPPPPASEKGRYERDYPPRNATWDGRPDREFVARDGYPPGPPAEDRYPPGPPIRDADRGRPPPAGYNAPVYNRVRQRSPSPMRRGSGPVDDSRPPMKRPREDFPPPEYYPPGGRDGIRRPPPGDYPGPPPPRSATPGAPPNSGWGPPPTSASSSATMAGGPPGDRDYRTGRDSMDYGPPSSYDRPRSPGPQGPSGPRMTYNRSGGGGGYGRGGEPRERGGYGMQRP